MLLAITVFILTAVGSGVAQLVRHRRHRAAEGHEHVHWEECGHEAVLHGDHVDFVHDGHRHARHEDHWDEHSASGDEHPDLEESQR